LKYISGNPIKYSKDMKIVEITAGGKKRKCIIETNRGKSLLTAKTQIGEETVKQAYEVNKIINIDEKRSRIDDTKLIKELD
jgi:hypothetical protein